MRSQGNPTVCSSWQIPLSSGHAATTDAATLESSYVDIVFDDDSDDIQCQEFYSAIGASGQNNSELCSGGTFAASTSSVVISKPVPCQALSCIEMSEFEELRNSVQDSLRGGPFASFRFSL